MTTTVKSGQPINLSQLQDEIEAAVTELPYGLTLEADVLCTYDAAGQRADLPDGAQAVVDAHVAMRPKTDAELAAEFQDPNTTPARRQEIRDMQSGLMPREQVPMT